MFPGFSGVVTVVGISSSPDRWYTSLKHPDWWVVIIAGITGIFVCWQSWETRKAANAARRQSEIASDTAKRQLRAYLCIDQSLVKLTDDGCMEGQLNLRNAGQTPAYKVRCWYRPIFREFPLAGTVERPPSDLFIATGVIPPQNHQILIAKRIPPQGPILAAVETGEAAYYIYGEAAYQDIFGDSHTLKFRLLFKGDGDEKPRTTLDSKGVRIGMLHMDVEGNSEDSV